MRHIVYCPHSRLAAHVNLMTLYFVFCLYLCLCCIVSVSLPNFRWIKIYISVLAGPLKRRLAGLICIVHPAGCTAGCVHTARCHDCFLNDAICDVQALSISNARYLNAEFVRATGWWVTAYISTLYCHIWTFVVLHKLRDIALLSIDTGFWRTL